jgi:ABC-type polysaccharide/polyol phosphate export permease
LHQPITLDIIDLWIASLFLVWTTTLGWSAIAASLVVSNRHIRHAIPVLLYAMIFALPVFYSMQKIDNQVLQTVYQFNPIAGAMDFLRSGFGMESASIITMASWSIQSLIWLTIGIIAFRRTEKTLADTV